MNDLDQHHIKKNCNALDEIMADFKSSTKALEAKIDQHLLQDHAPSRPVLRLIQGGKRD